jgi:hypothetical protein
MKWQVRSKTNGWRSNYWHLNRKAALQELREIRSYWPTGGPYCLWVRTPKSLIEMFRAAYEAQCRASTERYTVQKELPYSVAERVIKAVDEAIYG